MSGVFGPVAQLQVPDFAATAARAQDFAMRRQAMEQQNALTRFFQDNAQGFAAADPAKRMNVLAMLAAQGPQGAAMALPQIQSLREEMDWQNGGQQPMQPAPMPNAHAPSGGDYISRLVSMESGGDPNARNPRSSATGAAQFIDGTWMRFAQANPQLFQGMSREQILAARNNPDLSRQAADWYRRENMAALAGQGLPANDGTAALAHRFGAGDAARLLRADPNAPIASVVAPQVMQANPDLAGRTVGQVVGNYAQRFGGGGDTVPAQSGGEAPSIQRTPGGHILVPGYDPALIDRAHSMPNNPRARQFLEQYQRGLAAHLQLMSLNQRGERAAPPTIALGAGPHGPEGVYERTPQGLRYVGPRPEQTPQTVGTIPPGYQLQRGPDGSFQMVPIPGGPAEIAARREREQEEARRTGGQRTGNVVVQDLDRTLELLNTATLPVAGFSAGTLARIPGTAAADAARLLDSIRANVGFAQLNQMRNESPTGGALGQVTERELQFLQSVLGSLDQTQSPAQFRDNLVRVRNAFLDIVHGPGNGPPRTAPSFQRGGGTPVGSRAPDAAPVETPGPGGRGVASPPSTTPNVLRYNPRTGRIE